MARSDTLATVGEFGFLDRLLPRLADRRDVVVGPGDDCAVVRCGGRRVLITTDALIEDVHFKRDWLTPRQLGYRSLAVNLSDIAAMGGHPTFGVISVAAPGGTPAAELFGVHAGIESAARAAGMAIVGGNVSRADCLFLSLTVLGEVRRRAVTRAGARVGDELFVTGTLGDGALGVRQLQRGERRGAAVQRYRRPRPRLKVGQSLAERGIAAAMIDISDGLLQDLGHLTKASGVGAEIEIEALPRSSALRRLPQVEALELALRGGDDYELLCAVPRSRVAALERLRRQFDCPITRIGRCVPERLGIELLGAGREVHLRPEDGGWDHFANRGS